MQLSIFSAVAGQGEHCAQAAGAALAPMLSPERCRLWGLGK